MIQKSRRLRIFSVKQPLDNRKGQQLAIDSIALQGLNTGELCLPKDCDQSGREGDLDDMGNSVSFESTVDTCLSGVESSKDGLLVTKFDANELHEKSSVATEDSLASQSPSENAMDLPPDGEVGDTTIPHQRQKKGLYGKVTQALSSAAGAVGQKLHEVEDFIFTSRAPTTISPCGPTETPKPIMPPVVGGIRLYGCGSDEEHYEKVQEIVRSFESLSGEQGLKAAGLEYRRADVVEVDGLVEQASNQVTGDSIESHNQVTRLIHIETSTVITSKNRREFIADGKMYDEIARLCQECAQDIMIKEGELEWVDIPGDGDNDTKPLRALVTRSTAHGGLGCGDRPTLLIATGKGKVRAGIFSRQHIMVSGMECSTAIPIVREAKRREMNVVMVDPNAHGDRVGMTTFQRSMKLFKRWESDEDTASSEEPPLRNGDLFVLSHSQSGAHFARYLLEKSGKYVPHIRAIAFTDSTHNIQWARKTQDLHQLLQSRKCIYFKCSTESADNPLSPLETTGQIVETDHFWQHRFGQIQTRCAGTAEHSLTNWFVRDHIWDHFDKFLGARSQG